MRHSRLTVVSLVAALVLLAPGGAATQEGDPPDLTFLARSDDPADALAAGAVAGAFTAPLLVTPPDALAAPVAEALQALDPELVILVGGVVALAEQVEADVQALGLETRRVFGATRIETAIAVNALLEEFSPPGGPPGPAGADGAQGPTGAAGPSGPPATPARSGPPATPARSGPPATPAGRDHRRHRPGRDHRRHRPVGATGAPAPRVRPGAAARGPTGAAARRVPLAPPARRVRLAPRAAGPPARLARRAPARSSRTAPALQRSRPPSPLACQTRSRRSASGTRRTASSPGRASSTRRSVRTWRSRCPATAPSPACRVLQPRDRSDPDRHDRRPHGAAFTSPRPPTTPSPRCRGRSSP